MQSRAGRLAEEYICTSDAPSGRMKRSRAWSRRSQEGAIRARTMVELTVLALVAYLAFQAAPAVISRVSFLNELTAIANSPVLEDAFVLRRKILDAAAGRGIVVVLENVHVRRDQGQGKTIIDVRYELFLNFFPRFTYVWHVEDHVEALLF